MAVPIIIDIEASGFGPDSYPIEVGVVLADGRRFSRLIKPFSDWDYWSEDAEQVHGISRSLLSRCGRPGQEVAIAFNELLAGKQAFSDAWVVDKPWLDKLFYRSGIRMQFSLSPLEAILAEEHIEAWDGTKAQVIKRLNVKRHRASTDAMIIQQTFLECRQRQAS